MGFFSWMTSDTQRSIPSSYSTRNTFPVYMITRDGQIFEELQYEGYGEFGGKDIYVLAAEMNGFKGATDEESRANFFDKVWKRGISKGGKRYFYGDDFANYGVPIEAEGGKSANELRDEGWDSFGDNGGFAYWASQGWEMPKLVEHKPSPEGIKLHWNQIPYPQDCPDQGYFFDDSEDEDEWEEQEEDEDNDEDWGENKN